MRTGILIDITARGDAAIDWSQIAARMALAFPEALVLDGHARGGMALALPAQSHTIPDDDTPPGMACLLYLLTSKQGTSTIGWLVKAAQDNRPHARQMLREYGLDVRPAPPSANGSGLYLWVAYLNRQLSALFGASPWATPPNRCGRWARELTWIDGAIPNVSFFHCGAQTKAVLIPLELVVPGKEEGDEASNPLPDDCPVKPLGFDGNHFLYKAVNGDVVQVSAHSHTRGEILRLFGGQVEWLQRNYPRGQNGWTPEVAAEALMQACAKKTGGDE